MRSTFGRSRVTHFMCDGSLVGYAASRAVASSPTCPDGHPLAALLPTIAPMYTYNKCHIESTLSYPCSPRTVLQRRLSPRGPLEPDPDSVSANRGTAPRR